ncbi:Kinase-like protein [Mycena chlorophos]|uniref:Kinase-like protein n=1 Tax=Mycena chlorophos TaxID=658473 RepID=A0A8H6TJX4_MYCCL|nr:Kinase-like protein [Mycena chlorophos]
MSGSPPSFMPLVSPALYAVASNFTAMLLVIPFFAAFRAWNVGTVFLVGWLFIGVLLGMVNAIAEFIQPRFCTFSTVAIQAAMIGIPSATLAVNQRLYHIIRAEPIPENQPQTLSTASIRRMVTTDLTICLLPLAYLILQPNLYATHKTDNVQDFGCLPAFSNDASSHLVAFVPPIAISFVALAYGVLAAMTARSRRRTMAGVLKPYDGLTPKRYAKTLWLGMGGLVVFVLPSTILRFATIQSVHATQVALEFGRWTQGPAFGAVTFVLLGLGQEVQHEWKQLPSRLGNLMRLRIPFPSYRPSLSVFKQKKAAVEDIEMQPVPEMASNWDTGCMFRHDASASMAKSGPSTSSCGFQGNSLRPELFSKEDWSKSKATLVEEPNTDKPLPEAPPRAVYWERPPPKKSLVPQSPSLYAPSVYCQT